MLRLGVEFTCEEWLIELIEALKKVRADWYPKMKISYDQYLTNCLVYHRDELTTALLLTMDLMDGDDAKQ
jgi:hypothetical protein